MARPGEERLGEEEARLIWQTRPALKTEAFFETVRGLAALGRLLGYRGHYAARGGRA